MVEYRDRKYPDREYREKRTGPDFLVRWVHLASFIVWLFIAVLAFLIDRAKPEQVTFFDRLFDITRRGDWNQSLTNIAFILSLVLFVFSIISLIINAQRLKRKGDHVSKSLIISLIISVVSIVVYLAYIISTLA